MRKCHWSRTFPCWQSLLSLSCIYNVLLFICSALGPPLWCQVRPKEYILGILQISSAHNLFLQSLHLRPSNMTQTVNKPCNTVKLYTITGPYTVCLPSLMSVKFALLTLWKLLSSFTLFWWTRHLFFNLSYFSASDSTNPILSCYKRTPINVLIAWFNEVHTADSPNTLSCCKLVQKGDFKNYNTWPEKTGCS